MKRKHYLVASAISIVLALFYFVGLALDYCADISNNVNGYGLITIKGADFNAAKIFTILGIILNVVGIICLATQTNHTKKSPKFSLFSSFIYLTIFALHLLFFTNYYTKQVKIGWILNVVFCVLIVILNLPFAIKLGTKNSKVDLDEKL